MLMYNVTQWNDPASEHAVIVFDYDLPEPIHGKTRWAGWSCACGREGDGVDRVFAQDLAHLHAHKRHSCRCDNQDVSLREGRVLVRTVAYIASCDCGLREVCYNSIPRQNYEANRAEAEALAWRALSTHVCDQPQVPHQGPIWLDPTSGPVADAEEVLTDVS